MDLNFSVRVPLITFFYIIYITNGLSVIPAITWH
jgi:hypothetical protein